MERTRQAAIDALVAEICDANLRLKELRAITDPQLKASTVGDDMYAIYRLTAAARALAVLTSPQGL